MARLKELEDENRRLKKMYVEERLKAEIVKEALEKSGEAISPT
jgi:putative transposase